MFNRKLIVTLLVISVFAGAMFLLAGFNLIYLAYVIHSRQVFICGACLFAGGLTLTAGVAKIGWRSLKKNT